MGSSIIIICCCLRAVKGSIYFLNFIEKQEKCLPGNAARYPGKLPAESGTVLRLTRKYYLQQYSVHLLSLLPPADR